MGQTYLLVFLDSSGRRGDIYDGASVRGEEAAEETRDHARVMGAWSSVRVSCLVLCTYILTPRLKHR